MPVPLLELFKYVFIAIVWLFFLRILRAIWVEVKSSESAKKVRNIPGSERVPNSKAVSPINVREGVAVGAPSPAHTGGEEFRLLALEGSFKGREFRVKNDMLLGRSDECDLSLVEDNFASSQHAKLQVRPDGLWIEDLGSTNGTIVNSLRVKTLTQLERGDLIRIGKSVFEVIQL